MRKGQAVLLLLLAAALAGCGNTEAEEPKETPKQSEENVQKEEMITQSTVKSSIVLEDEESVYICGTYRLLKMNKESREITALWENKEQAMQHAARLYSEGSGLLVGDKIYFIEAWLEEDSETETKALSLIGTDGTGYQRLGELPSYSDDSMLLTDGELYVDAADTVICFEADEKGIFSRKKERDEAAAYKAMPENYQEVSYQDNGTRTLFVPEARKSFGYCLLRNEDNALVKVLPRSGKTISLPQELEDCFLQAYNSKYFLFADYDEGVKLYLTDIETLETRPLAEYTGGIHIVTMDKEYVYLTYIAKENGRQCIFERISLESGEKNVLFTDNGCDNYEYYTPEYLMDITLHDGYLYYEGVRDYKIYLIRRSLENPDAEELLGEPVYDSKISQVGRLESHKEEICSQVIPDFVLTEIDLKRLVVDDKFAGAAEINRILSEYENAVIEDLKAYDMEWREEQLKESEEEQIFSFLHYSYSSDIYDISYFDGNYLSFCQQDYDYTGGAHGMPYWLGYTFDLQTGQRLFLADIIENSEEELKDIVTKHFAEYINKNPDNFWSDALCSVKEQTDFNSRFYLTKEGIKFYFEPYALACYAAGFQQVVIPYEEFKLKIVLMLS